MAQIAGGYARARLVHVATALGVPDVVSGGPKTARQIARRVGADAGALARVLRGLVGVGVLAPASGGRFAATPRSRWLCRDAPGGFRTLIDLLGSESQWRSYGDLLRSVRTGRPAFDRAFGVPLFRYLDATPRAGAVFDEAMAVYSLAAARAVARAYDFSTVRTVVDVGGGRGGFLLPLLAAHPRLQGVLLDGPRALRAARRDAASPAVSGRCRLVRGDFFRSVPKGGDVYVLRNVVHDWEDARARRILRTCRRAMARDSALLLVEMVLPAGNRDWAGAVMDLDLLVLTGGRMRTRAEHRSLCRSAGLRVREFVDTPSGATVIEAVPA